MLGVLERSFPGDKCVLSVVPSVLSMPGSRRNLSASGSSGCIARCLGSCTFTVRERGVLLGLSEKSFVLDKLELAHAEGVFEALEAIYSGVPPSICHRQALCCRESPRIYFVEFLNLYRALTTLPRKEQALVQERSIRYAFLDLCDPTICCPLLERTGACFTRPEDSAAACGVTSRASATTSRYPPRKKLWPDSTSW